MKPFNKEEIRKSMCLYAVTDSMWLGNRTLPEVVKEALEGGATFLQIREKNLAYPEFVKLATEVKAVTDAYHITYVVDDDVELAKEIDADGVHIGQSDLALVEARRVLGPDKIIGVSAHSVAEAIEAERNGADYLGVGSVFTTSTKLDAEAVSKATLKEICEAVSIPVVAIGGIQKDNMLQLKGTKVDGVAVVSAIFAAPDIRQAAKELRMTADELVSELG